MNKKMTKSDYLVSMVVIFMLLCIVATFFYGVSVGKNRTEAKYASLLDPKQNTETLYTAYDQQHLISFYHTIFLPFREFQNEWFANVSKLEHKSTTIDPKALMQELEKLANMEYERLANVSMPNSSIMLQEAQTSYLKSLKLFSEGLNLLKAKSSTTAAMYEAIQNNEFIQEGKKYALQGQDQYYTSMLKWNEQFDLSVQADALLAQDQIDIENWQQLNLVAKNAIIAKLLSELGLFTSYYPQDAVVRIDELIMNEHNMKLQANDIGTLLSLLANTSAIRQNDFVMEKNRFYAEEVLPLLPFFDA